MPDLYGLTGEWVDKLRRLLREPTKNPDRFGNPAPDGNHCHLVLITSAEPDENGFYTGRIQERDQDGNWVSIGDPILVVDANP